MEPNVIGIRPQKLPPHLDEYREADRVILTGRPLFSGEDALVAGALDSLYF